MTEPRSTRARRHRNEINFAKDMHLLLYAFGDDHEPLPETVKVLDEIVTDFIIEICHEAASLATHARRNKVKVDDFRFVLRRDAKKLGRVQELLQAQQDINKARSQFDEKIGIPDKGGKEGKEPTEAGSKA